MAKLRMSESPDKVPFFLHSKPHAEILRRHRVHWVQKSFQLSAGISILLYFLSVLVQVYAINYATESASNPVTDIILSNTPVFDVTWLFVYGMFALIGLIALLCITHPKRIPFTLYSLTLFTLIRSAFVSLTHLSPFPVQTAIDFGSTITRMFFGGDLFFSGHTGAPFLMALLFWREKGLRYLFLIWSVFFATIVLLGHLHYSIDVLSAYFITYTIYCIAEWAFPKARALFESDAPFQEKK